MKILIKQNIFLDTLQKVVGPTNTKQTLPILSSVLIEVNDDKLKLTTTDLDITIIAFSQVNTIKPGKVLVPLKKILSIIKELPLSEITVELVKNNLLIRCENIEFKINTIETSEFPKIEQTQKISLIKLNSQELSKAIRLTSFCVGCEDTSYVLNGILFEIYENNISTVSTDGKRLSYIKCLLPQDQSDVKEKIKFILPIRVVNEIQKLIKDREKEIYLFIDKNKVGIDFKDTQIIARPIEGEFPDYNQYIPKPQNNKLTIDRRVLLSALKRAAILSTFDYQSIKFELKKNELVISKTTPQLGEIKEIIQTQYTGKLLQIGFNPHYLIDVLRNLEEDVVVFEFSDADKPAVIRRENYIYLVLPIKI